METQQGQNTDGEPPAEGTHGDPAEVSQRGHSGNTEAHILIVGLKSSEGSSELLLPPAAVRRIRSVKLAVQSKQKHLAGSQTAG